MNSTKKPLKFLYFMLYLVMLGTLLILGAWQLQRGLDKSQIAKKFEIGQKQALDFAHLSGNWENYQYQKIMVTGKWLVDYAILRANKVYRGQVGYELFLPMQISPKNQVVLVNSGWFSQIDVLNQLLDALSKTRTIQAVLHIPTRGFTIGDSFVDKKEWPKVIQYLDIPALSKAMQKKILPFVLVVDFADKIPLVKIWRPYTMNSTKHYGYAFQWWGLALVLLIFGVIWFKPRSLK